MREKNIEEITGLDLLMAVGKGLLAGAAFSVPVIWLVFANLDAIKAWVAGWL